LASAGAIAALPGKTTAWLRPPLTAPGDWWATTTTGLSQERLLPLREMVLCTARYPEPENRQRLPDISGKTDSDDFHNG